MRSYVTEMSIDPFPRNVRAAENIEKVDNF